MAEDNRIFSIEKLPLHLILEILKVGRLTAMDLVSLELTCRTFGGNASSVSIGGHPQKLRSMIDYIAFQKCLSNDFYTEIGSISQNQLLERCGGNWKRVLRFLQGVGGSSAMVETLAGNMQITTGRYHTLLISNSVVYSCGSSLSGVLGHGPDTTQCVSLTRIGFPVRNEVVQVSASENHAAFVLQSGEVFTCGDNSSFCCGHNDNNRPVFRPKLVESLKDIPCKQVAAGLNFTLFLTRIGRIYSCGANSQGQLGHGDTTDRPMPKIIESLNETTTSVVHVSAGQNYALAVTADGHVYSFGSGSNFCLGHGQQRNELHPQPIQSFRRQGIHVVRVSAGDEHAVAFDSNGFVYAWGKGYCGALGHGDERDQAFPELVQNLKPHLAIQVCARKRKTFVLVDGGSVYGFGWMGFGSLGFPDRGASDKVMYPRLLYSLRRHSVTQISTGLYHTVVLTSQGRLFGFGDNERAQLGHDSLRSCFEPIELSLPKDDDSQGITDQR